MRWAAGTMYTTGSYSYDVGITMHCGLTFQSRGFQLHCPLVHGDSGLGIRVPWINACIFINWFYET